MVQLVYPSNTFIFPMLSPTKSSAVVFFNLFIPYFIFLKIALQNLRNAMLFPLLFHAQQFNSILFLSRIESNGFSIVAEFDCIFAQMHVHFFSIQREQRMNREQPKTCLDPKISVAATTSKYSSSITEQKIPKANCSSHDDMKVLLLRRCSSVLTM